MSDTLLASIGQIHIRIEDIQRAVGFYRDVLGLTLLFEVPDQEMAFFDCGGTRLYLGRADDPNLPSNPLIYYSVDDITHAYDELKTKGVVFEREPHVVHKTPEYELWMTGFRDSENNFVHLMSEVRPESTI